MELELEPDPLVAGLLAGVGEEEVDNEEILLEGRLSSNTSMSSSSDSVWSRDTEDAESSAVEVAFSSLHSSPFESMSVL